MIDKERSNIIAFVLGGRLMAISEPLSPERLTKLFRTSPKDPNRIINREGTSIEFKETFSFGSMAQYFKAMASFANNCGGYTIFGVGDKPRRLLGLKEKSLSQFEELKVEEFTNSLLDYFSPEIRWEHCTFEYRGLSFGIIYTYSLFRKPCICKKTYDSQNSKYSLKEGDIYYRYSGRSERIRYTELASIIDEVRKAEEKQWLEFVQRTAQIGISNAALLDLESGKIAGDGGTVVIDSDLLSKIAFIHEGEFLESKGKPALRLIGDIQEISTGKIIVRETTKKVVRAIEPDDIIRAFLNEITVDEPMEYIKVICSATSANYPIYFLLNQAKANTSDALEVIEQSTTRGSTKEHLLERLNGKTIEQMKISTKNTIASNQKRLYRASWLSENVPEKINNLVYCIGALVTLNNEEIQKHKTYILSTLMKIYSEYYESASSLQASNLRIAICRMDEVLYLKDS